MENMVDNMISVCHICSYYENILFDNLVSMQLEATDARAFFFKEFGRKEQYMKHYVDEKACFHRFDRFIFHLKEKKVYECFKITYKSRKIDLVMAHSLFSNGYIAYKYYIETGIPYIVMIQNTDLNVFFRYRPYLRSIGQKILMNAKRIVFASETYLDTLLKKYIRDDLRDCIKEKSVIIPYGIDNQFFEGEQPKNKLLGSEIKVLSVGLICANKNHLSLCKAINELRKSGEDIKLTIVGKKKNQRVVEKLKSYDFVTVLDYVQKEDLKEIYREHDFFALTSITETFGLVYAEALSQGLPIVYSRGQGFDKQFVDGYIGYPVDAKDVGSIRTGLRNIIDNYDSIQRRTIDASKKFKWQRITNMYYEIFNAVIKEENE